MAQIQPRQRAQIGSLDANQTNWQIASANAAHQINVAARLIARFALANFGFGLLVNYCELLTTSDLRRSHHDDPAQRRAL